MPKLCPIWDSAEEAVYYLETAPKAFTALRDIYNDVRWKYKKDSKTWEEMWILLNEHCEGLEL